MMLYVYLLKSSATCLNVASTQEIFVAWTNKWIFGGYSRKWSNLAFYSSFKLPFFLSTSRYFSQSPWVSTCFFFLGVMSLFLFVNEKIIMDWRDGMAGKVLILYKAKLGLIYDTSYSCLKPTGGIPQHKARLRPEYNLMWKSQTTTYKDPLPQLSCERSCKISIGDWLLAILISLIYLQYNNNKLHLYLT